MPTSSRILTLALLLVAAGCKATDDGTPDDTDETDTDVVEDTDVADTDLPDTDVADTDAASPCTASLVEDTVDGGFTFTTATCWTVTVHDQVVRMAMPGDVVGRVEAWGAAAGETEMPVGSHENLNGKHIKDFEGLVRTVLLPGGTVVTMAVGESRDGTTFVSVHEPGVSYQFNAFTNTLLRTEADATLAAAWEASEPDGEASELTTPGEGVLRWDNVYDEGTDTDGSPLPRVVTGVPLGQTGGAASPNQVNDYYDDPGLGHT